MLLIDNALMIIYTLVSQNVISVKDRWCNHRPTGVSASFTGNLDSHRPFGRICVTITSDCGTIELCESVVVVDCDGNEPGGGIYGPGGPK